MIRRAGFAVVLCSVLSLGASLAATTGASAGAAGVTTPGSDAGARAASESATPGTGGVGSPALRASAVAPDAPVSAAATWSFMTTPNRGTIDNHIQEVSCINTTRCIAVGYNQDANGFRQSIAESLVNGVWKLNNVPQRGNVINNLWNVSCVPGNKCFAVGYYYDRSEARNKTLIATYSGGFWTLNASPNKGEGENYLFGIDCVDATHCVAVGRYQPSATGGRFRTLILARNGGTGWQVMSSPNRSATTSDNFLADVSCADATHCMAVGYVVSDLSVFTTLALERVDDTWTVRSTRNADGFVDNDLRDVSCPTAVTCFAVGSSDPRTSDEQTLIQRYSGGVWSIDPSPNRAATNNHLWGVSCATETDCVTVGQSQTDPPDAKSWTFVATLAAGTWTQTPSPSRGGTFNFMYGVSCPSPTRCTAGGDYINVGTQHYRTSVITSN